MSKENLKEYKLQITEEVEKYKNGQMNKDAFFVLLSKMTEIQSTAYQYLTSDDFFSLWNLVDDYDHYLAMEMAKFIDDCTTHDFQDALSSEEYGVNAILDDNAFMSVVVKRFPSLVALIDNIESIGNLLTSNTDPEIESLITRIRELEEQLSNTTNKPKLDFTPQYAASISGVIDDASNELQGRGDRSDDKSIQ